MVSICLIWKVHLFANGCLKEQRKFLEHSLKMYLKSPWKRYVMICWNHVEVLAEKIGQIPFRGCSLGQLETKADIFAFRYTRKTREYWELDSCQVSSNTVQRFTEEKLNMFQQIRCQGGNLLVHLSRSDQVLSARSPPVRRPYVVNFSHFRYLLRNRWTEFTETWQKASAQRPLPSLWGFFRTNRKTRWRPRPLIGREIFDFFSETAYRNLPKLYRKQELNVLYQVCVFLSDRKNKVATLVSDWLTHFRLLF